MHGNNSARAHTSASVGPPGCSAAPDAAPTRDSTVPTRAAAVRRTGTGCCWSAVGMHRCSRSARSGSFDARVAIQDAAWVTPWAVLVLSRSSNS